MGLEAPLACGPGHAGAGGGLWSRLAPATRSHYSLGLQTLVVDKHLVLYLLRKYITHKIFVQMENISFYLLQAAILMFPHFVIHVFPRGGGQCGLCHKQGISSQDLCNLRVQFDIK